MATLLEFRDSKLGEKVLCCKGSTTPYRHPSDKIDARSGRYRQPTKARPVHSVDVLKDHKKYDSFFLAS